MKFTALVEHIKKALFFAERALGKSSHLPILGTFLVHAEKNKVTISATNLEIGITTSISAKVDTEGKIAVPAHAFTAFVNQLNDVKAIFETDKKSLKANTDSYHASFQGFDAEDFPLIPKVSDSQRVELESVYFAHALEQVITAASVSDLRPELVSACMFIDPDGDIKIASTDTFRLAEKTIPRSEIKLNITEPKTCLIPLRTAQEVMRVAKEKLEPIEIAIDANQVLFRWKETEMVSRLLEGEFPDYQAVIPKQFQSEATISYARFLEALKVTGIFSSRLNDVKIRIDPTAKAVILRAADSSVGENEARVPVEDVKGNDLEVVFNFKFLLDGTNAFDAKDKLYIGFSDADKPALIKPYGDASYFYILMPLRM